MDLICLSSDYKKKQTNKHTCASIDDHQDHLLMYSENLQELQMSNIVELMATATGDIPKGSTSYIKCLKLIAT